MKGLGLLTKNIFPILLIAISISLLWGGIAWAGGRSGRVERAVNTLDDKDTDIMPVLTSSNTGANNNNSLLSDADAINSKIYEAGWQIGEKAKDTIRTAEDTKLPVMGTRGGSRPTPVTGQGKEIVYVEQGSIDRTKATSSETFNWGGYNFEILTIDGQRYILAGFGVPEGTTQSMQVIQEAMNHARDGDKILARAGQYGNDDATSSSNFNFRSNVSLYGGYREDGTRDIVNNSTVFNGTVNMTWIRGSTLDGVTIICTYNPCALGLDMGYGLTISNNTIISNYDYTDGVYSQPNDTRPWYQLSSCIKVSSGGSAVLKNNTLISDEYAFWGHYSSGYRFQLEDNKIIVPDLNNLWNREVWTFQDDWNTGIRYVTSSVTGDTVWALIDMGSGRWVPASAGSDLLSYDQLNQVDPTDPMWTSDTMWSSITSHGYSNTGGPLGVAPVREEWQLSITTSGNVNTPILATAGDGYAGSYKLMDSNTGKTYETDRIFDIFKELLKNKDSFTEDATGKVDPSLLQKFISSNPIGEGTLAAPLGDMANPLRAQDIEIANILAKIILNPTGAQKEILDAVEAAMREANTESDKELKTASEEFVKAVSLVLVAQAIPGLFEEGDFAALTKAMTLAATGQKELYERYLADTEAIYDHLAKLMGVYMDKDKLPEDFAYFTALSDKAKKKILVDMALEKLGTKDIEALTNEERLALDMAHNTLAPMKKAYLNQLKEILKSFVSTVNNVLKAKESATVKEEDTGMKAMFLLNKARK